MIDGEPRRSPLLFALLVALLATPSGHDRQELEIPDRPSVAAAPGIEGAAEFETFTSFSAGAEGWVGPSGPGGATSLESEGGNPTHNLRTVFNDFGITFSNATDGTFVRDLTAYEAVTIAVDLKVEQIDFFGSPVSRSWLVELRDYDSPEPGYPYTSVWHVFAEVSAALVPDWRRCAVVIADPQVTSLPAGWGGYGAEDGGGNPQLPAGRTFASVLAGYDEIVFTTFEPGWVFGFTDHTVRIDNPSLRSAIFGDSFEGGSVSGWSPTHSPSGRADPRAFPPYLAQ